MERHSIRLEKNNFSLRGDKMTEEQILNLYEKLKVLSVTLHKMRRLCELALFKYEIGGQMKTLPKEDIKTFLQEIEKLKNELKAKLEALS